MVYSQNKKNIKIQKHVSRRNSKLTSVSLFMISALYICAFQDRILPSPSLSLMTQMDVLSPISHHLGRPQSQLRDRSPLVSNIKVQRHIYKPMESYAVSLYPLICLALMNWGG